MRQRMFHRIQMDGDREHHETRLMIFMSRMEALEVAGETPAQSRWCARKADATSGSLAVSREKRAPAISSATTLNPMSTSEIHWRHQSPPRRTQLTCHCRRA